MYQLLPITSRPSHHDAPFPGHVTTPSLDSSSFRAIPSSSPYHDSPIVIEHVRVRDERARSQATDVEPKIATADAHPRPLELLQGGHIPEGRIQIADHRVVRLDRLVTLFDLGQPKPSTFFNSGRERGGVERIIRQKREKRKLNKNSYTRTIYIIFGYRLVHAVKAPSTHPNSTN